MAAEPPEGAAESVKRLWQRLHGPPHTGSTTSPGAAPAGHDGDGSGPKTPARLALDGAFKNQADLRLGLAENLRQARTHNERLDARVQRAFADFDPSIPAENAPVRRNHVEPDAAPFDAVDRVMRDRLDTLKAATPGAGITIHATSSLIQWDQGDGAAEDSKSGTIELSKLIDFLDERGVASLALPTSPALSACDAERKAKALLDGIAHIVDSSPDGADGHARPADHSADLESSPDGANGHPRAADHSAALDPENVADFVEKSVAEQMEPATAPEARLEYGLIPNGADSNTAQAHLLETFQLRPGPSDVTSYHDFSTLQIAFESVWTKIFDGELEALGRDVYREYVGLVDFLGYDAAKADRPISSLDDLTWLIGEIRSLSQIAQDGLPLGGGGHAGDGGQGGGTKDANTIANGFEDVLESLPGGRVGTAIGTLGISELVLLLMKDAATWGKKAALRWDDLVNGRTLPRGDRITGSVDEAVVESGNVQLVLWTDISNRKEIAFQDWRDRSQKPVNLVRVANFSPKTEIINHSGTGRPTWYKHAELIPSNLLADGLLEFASEQTPGLAQGRYVLGDLDKIVADRGRLTFYWQDS